MINHLGEVAALATAFFWSWTAIFFTAAGLRIGSNVVNILRLSAAVVILALITFVTAGSDPLVWFAGGKPGYLALSGLIGLAIGDSALFRAMVLFGPRRATLIMACVPIITAFLAWITIGEVLSLTAWAGILITVSGVFIVIFERGAVKSTGRSYSAADIKRGLILGLFAAVCQAVGLILAKAGMADTVSPLPATLMRMIAGWAGMMVITSVSLGWGNVAEAFKDRRALTLTMGGTIVGPVLGVWLSLVAIRYAEAGVAATLMGIIPIFVIPWVWMIYGEKTTIRAFIGTIAAVVGASILFMR